MKRLLKLNRKHSKYPIDRFASIAGMHSLRTRIQQNMLLVFAISKEKTECRLAAVGVNL